MVPLHLRGREDVPGDPDQTNSARRMELIMNKSGR
jgi:hypothetical protein